MIFFHSQEIINAFLSNMSLSIRNNLVTIVMPVYNAASFLEVCLDSIISQSYIEWELIVINDFSEDSSEEILKKYANWDNRIQVFNNTDKGIIPALKKAYAKSSGDYITRMDADDIMPVDKLKDLVQKLEEFPDSCITAKVKYFSDEILQDGFIRYAAWLNNLVDSKNHFKSIYKECVVPSPCWMMTRIIFDSIGAFDSAIYPEDYDQCFRLYEFKVPIVGIDKVLHLWRDHGERASRNDINYMDQHFIPLKIKYFLKLDYNKGREVLLWGAGKTGKMWAKALSKVGISFRWITGNVNKVGHNIYDVIMESEKVLEEIKDAQIISAIKEKGFAESNEIILQNLELHNDMYFMY